MRNSYEKLQKAKQKLREENQYETKNCTINIAGGIVKYLMHNDGKSRYDQ